MCKIEKVAFLCKIEGKFISTDVIALSHIKSNKNSIKTKLLEIWFIIDKLKYSVNN